MQRRWTLVLGVVLLLLGLLGLCVVAGVVSRSGRIDRAPRQRGGMMRRYQAPDGGARESTATTAAPGESIYVLGVGSGGPLQRTGGPVWFQRMGGGCAYCHGADGRGRTVPSMMGAPQAVAPDIRYSTLTSAVDTETGTTGWTDEQIAEVIRTGVEPDGEQISDVMPVWGIGDADMKALLDYLKELDSR